MIKELFIRLLVLFLVLITPLGLILAAPWVFFTSAGDLGYTPWGDWKQQARQYFSLKSWATLIPIFTQSLRKPL